MDKVDKAFISFFVWVFVACVIDLCWVGAEYTFEGVVHSSEVDGVVCLILATLITREFYRWKKGR